MVFFCCGYQKIVKITAFIESLSDIIVNVRRRKKTQILNAKGFDYKIRGRFLLASFPVETE